MQAARGGRDATADDDAACLLLWLILQPLRRRAHDSDARALDTDDVQAEIAAGVWEGIVGIAPGRSGVATLLINAGRRRARHAARNEIDCRLHEQRLWNMPPAPTTGDLDHPEQVVDLALHQDVIDEVEADLIASTRLGPEPLSHAALRHGITYDTAKHWPPSFNRRSEEDYETWSQENRVCTLHHRE